MSKKNLSLSTETADPKEIYFVIKNNIKIYPVFEKGLIYVEVDNNGKIKRFDKSVSKKEIDSAIALTVKYYYKLLKKT
jgi:hypothetical protein